MNVCPPVSDHIESEGFDREQHADIHPEWNPDIRNVVNTRKHTKYYCTCFLLLQIKELQNKYKK